MLLSYGTIATLAFQYGRTAHTYYIILTDGTMAEILGIAAYRTLYGDFTIPKRVTSVTSKVTQNAGNYDACGLKMKKEYT